MTEQQNIHLLYSQLRADQLAAYLTSQDWEVKTDPRTGRLQCIGPSHAEGQRYEIFVSRDTTARNHRWHLQRAVYALCDIENREPAEIVSDMLRMPVSPAAEQRDDVLQVRNDSPASVTMTVGDGQLTMVLEPGQVVGFAATDGTRQALRADIAAGSVSLR